MTTPSQVPARGVARDAAGLVVFLALSLVVAAVGGAVTATSVGGWYASLAKPSFNPPNGIFGPVWTLLYVLMGVAAWRVWRKFSLVGARGPLGLWGLQLALNLGWSVLFFGLRQIGPALAEILVLLAAVLATALSFRRLDRLAGLLLVPYCAWVAFASVLNFAIWRLN